MTPLSTYEAGAFLMTLDPTDGNSRRQVLREWVSSNNYVCVCVRDITLLNSQLITTVVLIARCISY